MAEAVVTFFLEKLSGLLTHEANLLCGVEEQVRLLQDKLQWMLLFLKVADVERRQGERVKLWVNQIRDVTCDAEDVIDEFMVKISQQYRHRTILGFAGPLTRCITCTHKLPVLHELANQIKVINGRVEEIFANKSKYGIESIKSGESSISTDEASLLRQKGTRVPIVEEWNVVGNEDSISEVTSLLIGGEPRRTVVSIVGMGGLGKTTLANKVYKSNDVRRSFDCFAWVNVSQQYQTKELLQGLLKCFNVTSSNDLVETEDDLKTKLRECLQDSKYLIVLDDIWNAESWDDLSTAFPNEENWSRVLITTRNKDVALHADLCRNLHELRFLNEMESWELFLKKIFPFRRNGHEVISCPPELEDLGKEMVVKCGGLPLAIVVLGGVLSIKDKTQITWSKVSYSISWHLSTHGAAGSSSCLGILALSYYNFPFYLKPCFLYMGLFPEDYEIQSSKLLKYWIAEGFIRRRGEEIVEDVAEDYLEELVQRSMLQVVKRKLDGRIKACRFHDLVRDFCITEAKEDQFFEVYGSVSDISKPNKFRRLAIHVDGLNEKEPWVSQIRNTQAIRSLLIFFESARTEGRHFSSFCRDLKLLRVLELTGNLIFVRFRSLEEIGDLIHLKYLALRAPYLRRIPSSIGRLVNLQFLDLGYTDLKTIPNVICNLTLLRYLCVCGLTGISIKGVVNLTNLQTLKLNPGSLMEGGGFGKLRELRKLVIIGCLVPYKKEMPDCIAKLGGLRSLKLFLSEEIPNLLPFSNHKFLYKLYLDGHLVMSPGNPYLFPPNLLKLTLLKSRLEVDPMEILEKLPNLTTLNLLDGSYLGKELVCSEGGFSKLQDLKIWGLQGLEEWVIKEGALRCLKRLEIAECRSVKMLPDGLRHLSTVLELNIYNMPNAFLDRVKNNVGGDWEKIKHIPYVDTTYGELRKRDYLLRQTLEFCSDEDYKLSHFYKLCNY